jgi:TPR repeat protein
MKQRAGLAVFAIALLTGFQTYAQQRHSQPQLSAAPPQVQRKHYGGNMIVPRVPNRTGRGEPTVHPPNEFIQPPRKEPIIPDPPVRDSETRGAPENPAEAEPPRQRCDHTQAFGVALKRANMGDSESMCTVGECYRDETGVTRDFSKAVYWLERAGNAGSLGAMWDLVDCFKTTREQKKVAHWLGKAAQKGDADAMVDWGVCFVNAAGVDKSPRLAVLWFTNGAKANSRVAMFDLALCLESGYGVPQQKVEALKWKQKSADLGYEPAKAAVRVAAHPALVAAQQNQRTAISNLVELGKFLNKFLGPGLRWWGNSPDVPGEGETEWCMYGGERMPCTERDLAKTNDESNAAHVDWINSQSSGP